jgi:hypothetical protein
VQLQSTLLSSAFVFSIAKALNIGYMAVNETLSGRQTSEHMGSWALENNSSSCCGVEQLNSLGTYFPSAPWYHTRFPTGITLELVSLLPFFIEINCDFVCCAISRVTDTPTQLSYLTQNKLDTWWEGQECSLWIPLNCSSSPLLVSPIVSLTITQHSHEKLIISSHLVRMINSI